MHTKYNVRPPMCTLLFCDGTEQVLEVMAAIDDLNFVEMAMLIDLFKVKAAADSGF